MKWITEEKARLDRLWCPRVISRFIEPNAEFPFVIAFRPTD
jgi:hypothetical protein